jgi:hypothetical protein
MIHDRQERVNILTRVFGAGRVSADGLNIACRCPSCMKSPTSSSVDRRKLKLAVRLDTGIYHCWVCGIRGRSIVKLIRQTCLSAVTDALRLWPHVTYGPVRQHEHADSRVELPSDFTLLANVIDDPRFSNIVRYAVRRGMTLNDMWRWRVGVSQESRFVDRIIIPSFDAQGALNYYTSRAVSDVKYPRYVNAECMKQNVIFNELDIDWDSTLTLTEGVFDLIATVDNAVPLLGNSLDEEFKLFDAIVSHDTPVVLALDADAYTHTQRIARLLYSYNIDVSVMPLGSHKDLGEMSRCEYRRLHGSTVRWSPKTALLTRIRNMDVTRSQSLMQCM